jgi:hypothetical protein
MLTVLFVRKDVIHEQTQMMMLGVGSPQLVHLFICTRTRKWYGFSVLKRWYSFVLHLWSNGYALSQPRQCMVQIYWGVCIFIYMRTRKHVCTWYGVFVCTRWCLYKNKSKSWCWELGVNFTCTTLESMRAHDTGCLFWNHTIYILSQKAYILKKWLFENLSACT